MRRRFEILNPTATPLTPVVLDVELELPATHDEMAAYVVDGEIQAGGCAVEAGQMAIAATGNGMSLQARSASHVMIIGGTALGERHIWWNFVSSSKQRIEQAKDDWREGRFDKVPGDDEFIPLPE